MIPAGRPATSAATPLVSIVIAVRNAATTLERCLESIHAQAWPHEILVADGGSTDRSVAILQAHAGRLTHWQSRPDGGVFDAWNQVLGRCTGEWVMFLGADDYFAAPDSLARLAGLDDGVASLLVGRIALVDAEGRVRQVAGGAWAWRRMLRGMAVAHTATLHRRVLFERYGTFTTTYAIGGDYEWLLRLGPDTVARYVDEVIVAQGDAGMSQRRIPETLAEWRRIQARHPAIGPVRAAWHYGLRSARYLLGRRVLPALTFGLVRRPRGAGPAVIVPPVPAWKEAS